MQSLLTSYALYFNKHHDRCGYVYQNRYKSILCDRDAYFLELVRYIHLNPIRAGLFRDLNTLAHHPWSGHATILGNHKHPWQNAKDVLAFFGRTKKLACASYIKFIRDGLNKNYGDTFMGGGLIRSAGGMIEIEKGAARVVDHVISDRHVEDRACGEPREEYVVENRVGQLQLGRAGEE